MSFSRGAGAVKLGIRSQQCSMWNYIPRNGTNSILHLIPLHLLCTTHLQSWGWKVLSLGFWRFFICLQFCLYEPLLMFICFSNKIHKIQVKWNILYCETYAKIYNRMFIRFILAKEQIVPPKTLSTKPTFQTDCLSFVCLFMRSDCKKWSFHEKQRK